MKHFKSHNIVILLFALSAVLWGVFFNISDGEKAYAAATYTISNTSTGGNCTSIGTWDNLTKTCTLTGNLSFPSIGGNGAIEITSNNITLDCAGYSLTATGGTGGSYGVYAFARDGVTIKNCTISGFFSWQINFTNTDDSAVIDNTVSSGNSGVYLSGSDNNYVIGNSANSTGNMGIRLLGSDSNYVYGNQANSNPNGFYVDSSSVSNEIIGNTMSSNTTGIHFPNSSGVSNNVVKGNTITGNSYGIRFVTTGGSGNTVNNNIVTGNSTTDIVSDLSVNLTNSDNNTCASTGGSPQFKDFGEAGNTCTWTTSVSSASCDFTPSQSVLLTSDITGCSAAQNGILVYYDDLLIDCNGHTVSGSDAQVGIYLNSGRSNVTITNCTVDSFATQIDLSATNSNINIISNTVADGIGIRTQGTSILLAGNTLDSLNIGIQGQAASNDILFNEISNAGTAGISLIGNSNTVEGNVLSSSQMGIGVYSDSNTITKNIIDHDGVTADTDGILLSSALSNVITSNVITDHTSEGVVFSADSTGNTLGGTAASLGNIIIGNTTDINDLDSNDGDAADDNNTCNVVSNWEDTGETGTCTNNSCGSGTIEDTVEECDDGNTSASDGCSATCTIESGYSCIGEPSSCSADPTLGPTSTVTNAAPSFTVQPDDGDAWQTLTSGASTQISEVEFIDSQTGWYIQSQAIHKSINGGTGWTQQDTTSDSLYDIYCLNANTCWVVGGGGTVLKTTNGGTVWSDPVVSVDPGAGDTLQEVFFLDTNTGFVVGNNGEIHKSTNGGANWTVSTTTTGLTLYDVYCTDTSNCWAVGSTGNIFYTADAGVTTPWTQQGSGVTTSFLRGLYCFDSSKCWAVGDSGTILYTSNGGTNWSAQTSGISSSLYNIHFVDANNGWVVGASGVVLYTTDGGTTWLRQRSGTTEILKAIHFYDSDTGWLGGGTSGLLLKGVFGSSDSTPADAGDTVTFTATATDANVNDYYLAICKTDAVTPGDNAAPTCTGGSWAITATSAGCDAGDTNPGNGACDSGTAETVTFTTSGSDVEQNDWYAFVCDKVASTAACSAASQGSGNPGSPFMVNHKPAFVDNFSVTDADDAELLTDGDMEASTTSAWTAGGASGTPTLSKETTDPRSGTRYLRIRKATAGQEWAMQDVISNEISATYRIRGYARSDGTAIPHLGDSQTYWWTGTAGTDWQYFDVEVTATSSTSYGPYLYVTAGGMNNWVEFDDVSVVDVGTEPGDQSRFNFEISDSDWDDSTVVVCDTSGFNDSTLDCNSEELCRTGMAWSSQTSPTSLLLYDVDFIDADTGWAVGADDGVGGDAVILNTTNGGTSWSSQTSGTTNNLYDVHFIDANTGYAVGISGTIRKTTDGGSDWTTNTQASGTSNALSDVDCIDAKNCWAAGSNGIIINTSDGGATTWGTQLTTGVGWSAIDMVDINNGWVVGNLGNIRTTANGGTSWTTQTNPTSVTMNDVHFIDVNTGWAVGTGGTIIKTIDGGANWVELTSNTTSGLYEVHFIDENRGWVAGSIDLLLETTDGGNTWTAGTLGINVPNGFDMIDENTAWAVGTAGGIVKGVDGHNPASTWTEQDSGATNKMGDVYFIDENTGWIVEGAMSNGNIYKTTNGGAIWTLQYNDSSFFRNIHFIDENTGWAIGSHSNRLKKTTDGGENWSNQNPGMTPGNWIDVFFVDSQTGWAIDTGGHIAKTINGGTNWTGQTSEVTTMLHSIFFIDDQVGWITGQGGVILHTTNGGTNWNTQTSGFIGHLYGSYFIDAQTGWVVGEIGKILYTSNGGTNWDAQTSEISQALQSVYFVDANTGWVTANSGVFGYTTNGGSSWSSETISGNPHLNSSFFVDRGTGYFVGSSGTVLRGYGTKYCVETDSDPNDGDANPVLIAIPEAHGNTNFTIHLFDEHNMVDDGGYEAQNVGVTDVAPTLFSYTFTSPTSPFGVIADGSQAVAFTARFNDDNGWDDITSAEGIFFDDSSSGVGNTGEGTNVCDDTAGNGGNRNCYIDAVCNESALTQVDATDVNAFCSVTVQYNANPSSDWEMHGNPTDGNGKETGLADSNVNTEIQTTAGVKVVDTSIAYGALAPDTASSGQTTSIGNVGNSIVDIALEGTDMCTDYDTCSDTPPEYLIDKNRQEWTQSGGVGFTWGTGHTLLATSGAGTADANGCANLSMVVRGDAGQIEPATENENIFWKLKIPATQERGTYTGSNTVAVISDTACTGTP